MKANLEKVINLAALGMNLIRQHFTDHCLLILAPSKKVRRICVREV